MQAISRFVRTTVFGGVLFLDIKSDFYEIDSISIGILESMSGCSPLQWPA